MSIGLNKLLATPRMSHAAVDNTNGTYGLYLMIKDHFNSDFEMVEVGSFEGASTLMFSLFVNKVYSVDCYDYTIPPTGRIRSMDKLFVRAEKKFIQRTKGIKNIVKIRKTSVEAAKDFQDGSLDAVYIDAEHDIDNVRADIRAWRPKIKKGGCLCGHDAWLPFMQQLLSDEGFSDGFVYIDSSWLVKV